MPDANVSDGSALLTGLGLVTSNPHPRNPITSVIGRRMSRRAAVHGLLGAGAGLALSDPAFTAPTQPLPPEPTSTRVLVRWGDPLLPGARSFDSPAPDPGRAAGCFGRYPGGLDVLPLPPGQGGVERALLVAHHGVVNPEQACPSALGEPAATPERAGAAMAAQGLSVVELRRDAEGWRAVLGSPLNRRVTGASPVRFTGPAAGHYRLRTATDPDGQSVLGTLGNRACGFTPWGSALSGEADFAGFFGPVPPRSGAPRSIPPPSASEMARSLRDGIGQGSSLPSTRLLDRFDGTREPNEANRFGWILEVDPHDPDALPAKRTALGRFPHAGCAHAATPDRRVVLYMTDAGRDEYLYRFISARPGATGSEAIDEGVLSVARFDDDGRLEWLPLVQGEGPLVAANGFRDQAEVLIETRRAADLLEPTPIELAGALRAVRDGVRLVLPVGEPRPGASTVGERGLLVKPPPLRQGDLATARVDHAAVEARWELLPAPIDPPEVRLGGPAGEWTLLLGSSDTGSALPSATGGEPARAGVLAVTHRPRMVQPR